MDKVVYPSSLRGEIDIIPSKSYLHRQLIAASLACGETKIYAKTDAKDVLETIKALQSLNADISTDSDFIRIKPINNLPTDIVNFDMGESGSTFRFLLPLISALGVKAKITGAKRLMERPIEPLISALREHSVSISKNSPYEVNGQLESGIYNIPAYISSQFITGLLLSLPCLKGDSQIIAVGEMLSKDYINITLDVLKTFNIEVTATKSGFFIKGGQNYISPKVIKTEGDFSNAAFFLSAGVISGDILVKGINENSKQGDRKIIDILKAFGGNIKITDDGVLAKKSNLYGITIDAKDIPDLVPIISIVAANASGKTVINNVERLRDKESNRLEAIINMLTALGIKATYDKSLNITGGKISGGIVNGCNDHRIVMSAAVAGLNTLDKIIITDSQAVDKSYPQFFKEFINLGGKVDV